MTIIAERRLLYSIKNSSKRHPLKISISQPFTVTQDMVDFSIGDRLVGCKIETIGLEKEYQHVVYGMDSLQAINMASNIDNYLEHLQKKYDLFWHSGEPYFDEE